MIQFLKDTYYVAWGDLRFMRHNIGSIIIMSIMSPILYLLAFGYGLGEGVIKEGVSYVAFIIPGIAALTSLSSSFSSTSTRLNVQRLYYRSFDEMIMCPLSIPSIVMGKSMLGAIRGLISSGIIFTLGLLLAPEISITPLFILCLVISCFSFSFLGVAAALLAKTHQSMATFNSLVILPMTFLCGTFFSVANMPGFIQAALYALPLTHSSSILRAAALGWEFPWWSLIVLLGFGIAFFALDMYLVKTRKI